MWLGSCFLIQKIVACAFESDTRSSSFCLPTTQTLSVQLRALVKSGKLVKEKASYKARTPADPPQRRHGRNFKACPPRAQLGDKLKAKAAKKPRKVSRPESTPRRASRGSLCCPANLFQT